MLQKFLRTEGISLYLPLSFYIISKFMVYMFEVRQVNVGTIKQYLSGLKFFHEYSGLPLSIFEDPRLIKLQKAMLNLQRLALKPSTDRRVFTFDCLVLCGHELSLMTNLGYEDKQTIWCAILCAYWGSLRFGEILPGSHGVVEIKLLTWRRIRYVTSRHLTLFIALPKQEKKAVGVIKHLYKFKKDPMYCPIWNLRHLYTIRAAERQVKGHHKVFELPSGKLLRMYTIRKLLKAVNTHFPPGSGKLTCHSLRAGVAAMEACHPDQFTEKEVRDAGLWDSNCVDKYTRIQGVGQAKTHKKFSTLVTKRAAKARRRREGHARNRSSHHQH